MKVKDLRDLLWQFDDDDYVVIAGEYVDDIAYAKKIKVTSFWGNDYEAIALLRGDQLGRRG